MIQHVDLFLCRVPNWFTDPPPRLCGVGAGKTETQLQIRVIETVADDSVCIRIQASNHGVMIGEC